MGAKKGQAAWDLAGAQQNVVSREQLLALGFTARAIKHRVERGRLHPMWPGVYSVGTPHPTRLAIWMGAVLACGEGAAASHGTAAALWGLRSQAPWLIHISVPARKHPRPKGVLPHRRVSYEVTKHRGIPVTTPAQTITDIAPGLTRDELEQTINQADFNNVIKVPALRAAVQEIRAPGGAKVRVTIDRRTFTMTRSQLERLFLRIAKRAGLPRPLTCVYVNGYEVDFYWPELRLVVEADGASAHRTPAQRSADYRRDQVHAVSEVKHLRFTHGQIRYEPAYVEEILIRAAAAQARSRGAAHTGTGGA
jgi:very-short-patch-repair endonuclease